jgi:hypothetical protein
MEVASDVVVADAMSIEKSAKLPILLGNSPSGHLNLGRGLDALELIDPEPLFELLEIFSPPSP